jgi:EAL domain-containing protein (putative c-di-GMP-specific phosphodiesterase class I)/GGDEF domain-containing protein
MAGFSSRLLRWARWPWLGPVLPLLVLPVYGVIGNEVLLILAAGLPVLALLLRRFLPAAQEAAVADQVITALDTALRSGPAASRQTGCLVLQFDTLHSVCDRLGRARQSEILAASVARIRGALRPGDLLFALEDGGLVIALAPSERLDLESLVRIAGRLQLVAQQPMSLGTDAVQLTCCIGVCHAGQTAGRGRDLLDAAQVAVEEAMHHAPGAIRAYTADLAQARLDRDALRAGFAAAVAEGQVCAYFQPQVSTDSGAVSGMEALVRWHHPERGLLTPGNFLPAIEGTDLMALLGQTMLTQSLAALRGWDQAGLAVPTVSVNFSGAELSEPDLPERLVWQLDRYRLAAHRLTIEVLESVVARETGDIISRNIQRIADMGCGVDMDDFGTGNASITSIRRFALRRLKIDRSFVRAVDTDRDQQQLVTAILSMAERLGLETLAEGVETQGEHAMLAQLGCGHVQGFVVARPMPVEDVLPWLTDQRDHLAEALRIGVRAR